MYIGRCWRINLRMMAFLSMSGHYLNGWLLHVESNFDTKEIWKRIDTWWWWTYLAYGRLILLNYFTTDVHLHRHWKHGVTAARFDSNVTFASSAAAEHDFCLLFLTLHPNLLPQFSRINHFMLCIAVWRKRYIGFEMRRRRGLKLRRLQNAHSLTQHRSILHFYAKRSIWM